MKKNKSFIFIIILFLFSFLFLFNDAGIIKWYQLKAERNNIKDEIKEIIANEEFLSQEIFRLENDNNYIKKLAKDKFHMVQPGEKIFRIIDKRTINKKNLKNEN